MKSKISFLDGSISAVSIFCMDTDYVPLYGVESVNISGVVNIRSIEKELRHTYPGTTVSELTEIYEWKKKLREMVERWVTKKLLQGRFKESSGCDFLVGQFCDFLEENIECRVEELEVWYARLQGDSWGYDTEALFMKEENHSYFLFFGFSD